MPKREIDVLIYYLMKVDGAFKGLSKYETALRLKITPRKLKGLDYEARLRFDHSIEDKDFQRNQLKEYFENDPILRVDDDKIKIKIIDPVLKDSFEALANDSQKFTDHSFSGDVITMTFEDYGEVLGNLFQDDKELKKHLKKHGKSKFRELFSMSVEKAKEKGAEGAVDFIKNISLKLLQTDYSQALDQIDKAL